MIIKEQSRLMNTIDTFTINNLPHSIMLLGESGAGHEDVCNYIAEKFNLWPCDITEFINIDYISEIQYSSTPTLYFVNVSKISSKEQNILLKMYEEPSRFAYIVLNCFSDDFVIDPIKNRSYTLKMDVYRREYLSTLITNKDNINLILDACTTPGQIEIANRTDMTSLDKLCSTIISSIGVSNYQNALSIANKINFSDKYDKFDLNLFIKVLKNKMLLSKFTNKQAIYADLNTVSKYISSMNNKQQYFENFLTKMWVNSKC